MNIQFYNKKNMYTQNDQSNHHSFKLNTDGIKLNLGILLLDVVKNISIQMYKSCSDAEFFQYASDIEKALQTNKETYFFTYDELEDHIFKVWHKTTINQFCLYDKSRTDHIQYKTNPNTIDKSESEHYKTYERSNMAFAFIEVCELLKSEVIQKPDIALSDSIKNLQKYINQNKSIPDIALDAPYEKKNFDALKAACNCLSIYNTYSEIDELSIILKSANTSLKTQQHLQDSRFPIMNSPCDSSFSSNTRENTHNSPSSSYSSQDSRFSIMNSPCDSSFSSNTRENTHNSSSSSYSSQDSRFSIMNSPCDSSFSSNTRENTHNSSSSSYSSQDSRFPIMNSPCDSSFSSNTRESTHNSSSSSYSSQDSRFPIMNSPCDSSFSSNTRENTPNSSSSSYSSQDSRFSIMNSPCDSSFSSNTRENTHNSPSSSYSSQDSRFPIMNSPRDSSFSSNTRENTHNSPSSDCSDCSIYVQFQTPIQESMRK